MFNCKRSDLEVVRDILRITGSKTTIMYGANLSYLQTQKYLRMLTDCNCLQPVDVGSGRYEYRPTERATELLRLIDSVEELVEGCIPNISPHLMGRKTTMEKKNA